MDIDSANKSLRQLGFKSQFLAAGMEGFVFDIGHTMLAKVWINQTPLAIQQLRSFYTQLRTTHLPFATPEIHEVLETASGVTVSIEERLPGVPLKSILERNSDNEVLSKTGMEAVISVVEALQIIGDVPAVRDLAVLNGSSLWTQHYTWNTFFSDLVTLRVNKYKAVLEGAVSNLEHIVKRVVSLLQPLSAVSVGVIHGDICTENVLVDDATMTPTGLLDFGFLTTSADPLFEAVISTLIFDMYSPRMPKVRKILHDTYAQKWGQPFIDRYPLYKALYALVTSNAYSKDGEDGHFRWCMEILNDEETRMLTI
jgi:aminoglycoside phosphotransferase (APT) family kinase protein